MTTESNPQPIPASNSGRAVAIVSAHVADHIAGGYPEVTFDRIVEKRGRPVRGEVVEVRSLDDPTRGACGILDTDDQRIRIFATDPDATIDRALVERRVRSAYAARQALGLIGSERVYRLIAAEGDGFPGIIVDVYGEFVDIMPDSEALMGVVELLAAAIGDLLAPRGTLVKPHLRHGGRGGKIHRGGVLRVLGEEPPRRVIVREGEQYAEAHLLGGVNTGFFPDLRIERQRMQELGAGRRAISLFSYTATLAVALARGGAAHLTMVDHAPGIHQWAARNFAHNQIDSTDTTRFAFIDGDALAIMEAAIARAETYDLVLLDPPTHAAKSPSAFSLKRHLPKLVELGARMVAPGGRLWLATSARGVRASWLEPRIREGLIAAGGALQVVTQRGMPPEHPTLDCYPRGSTLKCFEAAAS